MVRGIGNVVNNLLENIKEIYFRRCNVFLFAFLSGIIMHFVMLADYLFNHDAITAFRPNESVMLAQGKWFAFAVGLLKGYWAVHYISGILGIIFLSLTVVFILEIFEIDDLFLEKIVATLYMSFPTVAVCLNYNGLDYFAITAFLAVLSAFFAKKKTILSIIVSIITLSLSLGAYQGYIGFTASLLVCVCILKLLYTKNEVKDVIKEGLIYISVLLFSIICYYAILQITLFITKSELGTYKNTNSMLQVLKPAVLYKAISDAYRDAVGYIWDNNLGVPSVVTVIAFRIFVFIVVIMFSLQIIELFKKKQYLRVGIIVALYVGILPLAVNFIGILSNNVSFYFVTAYPLVILFIGSYCIVLDQKERKLFSKFLRIALNLIALFLIYIFFVTDNTQYEKARYNEMQINAKAIELATIIHQTEGVTNETPIVFVGEAPFDFLKSVGVTKNYEDMYIEGVGSPSQLIYNGHILGYYLTHVLSYDFNYRTYDEYKGKYMGVIEDMPIYPEKESVKMIDGNLFIKLSSKCS